MKNYAKQLPTIIIFIRYSYCRYLIEFIYVLLTVLIVNNEFVYVKIKKNKKDCDFPNTSRNALIFVKQCTIIIYNLLTVQL